MWVLNRVGSFVSPVCLHGIFGWRLWCVPWGQAVLCITGVNKGRLWMVGRIRGKYILQLRLVGLLVWDGVGNRRGPI